MNGIQIAGTGMYAPPQVVTNDDFSKFLDTSDEWISSRTGIRQRHISSGEPTWYMGVEAARQAVENAGLQPQDLDVILCTSVTSEYVTPSMSCVVQAKLGAFGAFCMDVNAACSGFVFALDLASRYLLDTAIQNVLIVSAESLSSITDYDDRSTCVLFGDGAGACVVRRGEGAFASHLVSDGRGGGLLFARNPAPSHRFRDGQTPGLYDDGFAETHGRYLCMNGREVYKFAIQAMPEAVQGACEKAGVTVAQLDWIVPHQANQRIVDTAASRLGVSADRMYGNLARFGNTSSASIPLCLYEMDHKGVLKPGNLVCLVGFGGGLTAGAAVFEW